MDDAIQPSGQPGGASAPTAATAPDEVDWTGQVLGEFRLMHRLGRGGMGQVYLAEQTSLKRKVALKLLHPDLAANDRSLQRFKAEAENVARATHANIVQIYTIGQANGINYLALEYVEGRNLREYIEKKGTPELSLGLHVMQQVAAALQRAGELGIIHRDIKPENILLTRKGEVKVADFGLSRCFAEEQAQSITQSQVTMGTPLYMSPEQVERKSVDTRTDIYSFGVTCYHMFAGTPPFRGTSPIEVAYQHVHEEPESLAAIRPDLPAALCAIVQKMMAKKPEDRYQSPGEIVRDVHQLREALNLGTVAAISMSSSFVGVPAGTGLPGTATRPWQAPAPATPWLTLGAIFVSVLLALTGGLGLGYWLNYRPPPVREQTNGKPIVEAGADKKSSLSLEDEQMLLHLLHKVIDSPARGDVQMGRQHALQLIVHYLRENRLDDAEKLSRELNNPKIPSYRFLSRIGHACVLAFKDDHAASNKEFAGIFADMEKKTAKKKDDQDSYLFLWKEETAIGLRAIVAKAIEHNLVNDPENYKSFADRLDVYRAPPRPRPSLTP